MKTERSARPKYFSLQAGRGIAALLVVVYHSGHFAADPARWDRPDIFAHLSGGSLGVEAFFVLSGMVILTAHRRDVGHPSSIPSYLWKRFRRIYPLYWLVLIVTLASQLVTPDPLLAFQHRPLAVLSAALLLNFAREAIVPVAWTLHHEVMFYAVFATALLNRWLGALLLGLWLLTSALHMPWETNDLFFFSPLHLLFGMGMAAAWLLARRTTPAPALLFFLGLSIFGGHLVYAWFAGLPVWAPVSAGLGSMLAFLGAAELEMRGRLSVPAWLAYFGDASYAVYLIHFGVMSKMSSLGFRLNAHLHWPIVVWLIACVWVSTVAGCLLHAYVERPLLKWMSGPAQPKTPPAGTVLLPSQG